MGRYLNTLGEQYFITNENFYGQNGRHEPGKWCVGTVCWAGAIPCSEDFDTREEAVAYFGEHHPNYKLEGDRGVYIPTEAQIAKDRRIDETIEKAMQKFRENHCSYDIYVSAGCIVINITWGDWKHDHGYTRYIMEQLGCKEVYSFVTEENGSDCYSATHYFDFKN